MKFFVEDVECWFIATLLGEEIEFTVVDSNELLSDDLDGARLHGPDGTLAFFKNGRASTRYSRIQHGFQLRAAGESLKVRLADEAEDGLRLRNPRQFSHADEFTPEV